MRIIIFGDDALDQQANSIELVFEIHQNLSKLLGYDLTTEQLYRAISDWNTLAHVHKRASQEALQAVRDDISSLIRKNNTTLKRLEIMPVELRTEISGWQLEIKKDIKLRKLSLAILKIPFRYNREQIMWQAMISVFDTAKEFGLEPLDKVGRGNKNPILVFAEIITGVTDRERLHRYYKKYRAWIKERSKLQGQFKV